MEELLIYQPGGVTLERAGAEDRMLETWTAEKLLGAVEGLDEISSRFLGRNRSCGRCGRSRGQGE